MSMIDQKDATARRLTVVRTLHVGDHRNSKKEFAELLGIMPSRWNNLERGWQLTLHVAWLLVDLDDRLSISYLAEGKYGDVPHGFAKVLKAKERELFPTVRRNKGDT